MTLHNPIITGRGGKRPEQNADNTLRSKARARIIELISEGPIVGLVGGAKSIYFDTTPIQNEDNSYNYENVIWDQRFGDPDQAHFTGSNAVETTYSVETPVTNSGGPIQRTIVETKADAVNVIVRLNSLFKVGSGGVLNTFSVSYKIEVRPLGGTWTTVITNNLVNEKCTAPVQFKHRVDLPLNGSPWDIRVVRISTDDPNDQQQSSITFEGYVVLVEGKFVYPHSACVFIEVDAESMGSNLPQRFYKVRGRIIDVPTNYNPVARTYSGIWDGTFKQAWTNNPAWIFYDMVINDRYGIGEFIDVAKVDKWSLYTIAQHCDQPVPSGYDDANGNTVTEPRYTYNGRISNRQEAYYALSGITSAWRGMGYWSLGQLFATADMQTDPVKLVAPANVIDGHFSYSSTALKARHSAAIVKWKDPNEFYQDATELVIDETALARYGWREKQVDLPGCTSRGLAHRYGRWILDVEQNETETVEYTASWDHADLRPGDIIAIADPRKAQVRAGGRIKNFAGTAVTLDASFTPAIGETYELWLTMQNGSILKTPILAFVGDTVTIAAQPLVADPNAMYVVAGTDVQPRQFRVLTISEVEQNRFTVTALFHDPNKYARVEQGISFTPIRYKRELNVAYPPTGLIGREVAYAASGILKSRVTLSWTAPTKSAVKQYIVSMHTPFENDVPIGSTARLSFDVLDLEPGAYTFMVRTVDRRGFISKPAVLAMTIGAMTSFTVPTVINLELVENPGSTVFDDPYVAIQWASAFPVSSVPGSGVTTASPLYSHNTVNVYRMPTNELLRSVTVVGTSFTYDYITNLKDNVAKGYNLASRNLRFEVSVTDITDKESATTVLDVSNPVPAVIVPSISISGTDIGITWPSFAESDVRGVRVWVEQTSGFNPLVTAPKFEGLAQSYTFSGGIDTDYYIRIAAFDSFGKTGLNISPEYHAKTTSLSQIFQAAGLSVPRLVGTLPASGAFIGETVLLTTNFKLYRWNGTAWTANVDTSDLTGKIAQSQLTIADLSNLIEDPGFELFGTGLATWGVTGLAGFSLSTYQSPNVRSGNYCMIRNFSTLGSYSTANSTIFDVLPGDNFRLSAYVKRDSTGVCSSMGVRIQWFTRTGSAISNYVVTIPQSMITTSWQQISGVLTAPANATSARVNLIVFDHSAGTFFWDDLYCYRANSGKLLVDGDILGNHVAANTLTAGLFAAGAVKASNMEIDDSLSLDALGAGFQIGKSSTADFTNDGLYMGRTINTDGSTGFGFLMGRTALSGANRYIENTEQNGLQIVNASFGMLLDLSNAPETIYTTNQSNISLAGKKSISLSIQAGGAGGKGGDGSAGTNGGNTVVKLRDGTTVIKTWTTTGGVQGAITTGYGQNSLFGTGGAPGTYYQRDSGSKGGNTITVDVDAGDATGYGAGGGGGSINKTAQYGGAKGGYISVTNYDISALASPNLVITIGAKGVGGGPALTAPYTSGGDGSPGMVKLKTATTAVVSAGVIPLAPTAYGTFSLTSGQTGAFPVSETPGLWVISEVSGISLNMDIELHNAPHNGPLILRGETHAAFVASKVPVITLNGATAKTLRYKFHKMKI